MLKCVSFEEVKMDIVNMMKRSSLIPVIGSGFTQGCYAKRGNVPSGEEYKKYMISQIVTESEEEITKDELINSSFSEVASVYKVTIDEKRRYDYLQSVFTNVKIDDIRKKILQINWPYIYTVNIDDGIENNSEYKTILYANREIREDIFEKEKCVIKLHGDIKDIICYKDSNCEVFDQRQYVVSIEKNALLLNKLKHDYQFLNLIYIGCSLSDEIDILFSSSLKSANTRYYCVKKEPTKLEKIKLENYGITHCIIFEEYCDIYEKLMDSYNEAQKIVPNELKTFYEYEKKTLHENFESNSAFLFQGKDILNSRGEVIYPSFFVSREVTNYVVQNIDVYGTQVIVGNGCSGKTYVAYDVAKRVNDRDVFVFRTKDGINNDTFDILLNKEKSLVICDSKSLTSEQIEWVFQTSKDRVLANNSFLILEGKSNRDLASVLEYLKKTEGLETKGIVQYDLENKLSPQKTEEINILLAKLTLGVFSKNVTIADNIIHASDLLIQKSRFSELSLCMESTREIASLIVLATKGKIYLNQAVTLDLVEELDKQCKKAMPLIEKENTWTYEIDPSNNSPIKYVINAEYWLANQLDTYVQKRAGLNRVIKAYRYIIEKIISVYGEPSLKKNSRKVYKEYILFDNIFRIFSSQGTTIIRKIYEELSNLLSTDPNYLHQRAKCYIRSAYDEKDENEKVKWLDKAYKDAIISNEIFIKMYEEHKNEKINISAAHSQYTASLALCHISKLKEYRDIDINNKAIECLYLALNSPYNSMDFVINDSTYNYNDVVNGLIRALAIGRKYEGGKKTERKVEELIKISMGR